jgi:hypothetical protein
MKQSWKMTVFWDAAPCILVESDRPFRGAYCLHHQGVALCSTAFPSSHILACVVHS